MKTWITLLLVFALVGCAGKSLHKRLDPEDLHTDGIVQDFKAFEKAEEALVGNAEKALVRDEKNGAKLKDYTDAGFTLSDGACRKWLFLLEHTDRELELGKDMFNIVGNALLGLAGINGASAASLARASIAIGGVNAAVDTYRAEIIQGVIPEIRKQVFAGRELGRAKIEAQPSLTFAEAKRRLRAYHDTCSASAVRALLNDGLRAVKYTTDEGKLGTVIEQANASVAAQKLYADIYGSSGTFSRSNYGYWSFAPICRWTRSRSRALLRTNLLLSRATN